MRRPLAILSGLVCALALQGAGRAQDRPATPAPKVAVVVIGDPDEGLRAAAQRVEAAIGGAGLSVPSDPALRRALRGEAAPREPDGLERVRRERRRLGLSERDDLPVLRAIGRMAGAAAVAAVRRRAGDLELVVLDVSRGGFFEGELDAAAASAASIGRFVQARARAAARRPAAEERAAQTDRAGATQASPPASVDAAEDAGGDAAAGAGEGDDDGGFFDEWPLLVAGALLVGAILFFTLDGEAEATGPPVLRFVSGGE